MGAKFFSLYFVINSIITIFVRSKNNKRIVKVIKGAKILNDLKKDGWYMVHQKGSHRKFKHSVKKGSVTVNGTPSTDFFGDLLKSIETQSGLIF